MSPSSLEELGHQAVVFIDDICLDVDLNILCGGNGAFILFHESVEIGREAWKGDMQDDLARYNGLQNRRVRIVAGEPGVEPVRDGKEFFAIGHFVMRVGGQI